MSTNKFTDAFKRDAVAQVVDGGYSMRQVAERLGVRQANAKQSLKGSIKSICYALHPSTLPWAT